MAMTPPILLFDIEQGFTFYNEEEWDVAVTGWRTELKAAGLDVDEITEEDLVEARFGVEAFIEELPRNEYTRYSSLAFKYKN